MEKRALGYSLIILGIVVMFLKPITSITGFSVTSEALSIISNAWFFFIGLGMIVAGIVLSYQDQAQAYQEQQERYSHLKDVIGNERYSHLSEEDKKVINKSYRRHQERYSRYTPPKANASISGKPTMIRTSRFNRAIRGHDSDLIERTIAKIGTGLGKEEKLKHLPGWSIRTTKGVRIIFDREEKGKKIKLRDYDTAHKYE